MAEQAEKFDPYQAWLGIPPEEQPPSYYRLLGLVEFESDASQISRAAQQAITHVRSFQTGARAAWSHRILQELVTARSCLLDPQRKETYDRSFRVKRGIQRLPQRAEPLSNAGVATTAPTTSTEPDEHVTLPSRPVFSNMGRRRARRRTSELFAFVCLLIALFGLAIAAVYVFGR